jgi:hypothetical protein
MFDLDEILAMQIRTVAQWHHEPVTNPYAVDIERGSVVAIACQQHQYNYLLWHEEDIARSPDVTDSQIANVKRNIDRYNQLRNDWIEKVDDWITDDLTSQQVQVLKDAVLATETPGSAIDRLSIISLRIYHLEEQLERTDVDESHREKVKHRLAICRLQHAELSQSLRELLENIYAGKNKHRTYRQFKMYNDPSLNPYLYNRAQLSASKV